MTQYQSKLPQLLQNIIEEESLNQIPSPQAGKIRCLHLPFEFNDVVIKQENGVSMLLDRYQIIQRIEELIFKMPDLGIAQRDVYLFKFEDLCGLLSFLQREREERGRNDSVYAP